MKTLSRFVVAGLLLTPALAALEKAPALAPTTPLLQAIEQAARCAEQATGDLGLPEPTLLNHCNAQQTCPLSGCFIACTGHVSCTVQTSSVTCDNVVTGCPSCPTPPTSCLDPCCWCECKAAGQVGCFRCCTDF